MDTPLLSVAMPSYNVERYLERGLASFDDSRLSGLVELFIVDDGSTDATPKIAEEYTKRAPAIFRLVRKENGGHGSAVNAGLEQARGKYFRIVDGDDWIDIDALLELLSVLKTAEVDIVVDRRTKVDMASGKATSQPFLSKLDQRGTLRFEEICSDEEICDFLAIHNMTVRTALLRNERVNLLEKTFYVDCEYVMKASLHAETVSFVDLKVYQYLVGNCDQSVADDNFVKHWEDHDRVAWELLRTYAETADSLDEEHRRYAERRVDMFINTHYNIALIFDKDRKRGKARAKEFRKALFVKYPDFAKRGEKRYRIASLLHAFGVNSQERLNKLIGRNA